MKWYGFLNSNKKTNNQKLFYSNKTFFKYFFFYLYVPYNWNFLIFKSLTENSKLFQLTTKLYIYSNDYFFIIPFFKNFKLLNYDKNSNSIFFKFSFINNYYAIFWNYFKLVFYSFSKIFFKKLKFKGKGYYVYKNNRNTFALQFGYSHLYYLYSFFTSVKFLTKTTILIFGLNFYDINKSSFNFFNIKKINIFTGRGIRFSRQIIYRKTGKVSSYR